MGLVYPPCRCTDHHHHQIRENKTAERGPTLNEIEPVVSKRSPDHDDLRLSKTTARNPESEGVELGPAF